MLFPTKYHYTFVGNVPRHLRKLRKRMVELKLRTRNAAAGITIYSHPFICVTVLTPRMKTPQCFYYRINAISAKKYRQFSFVNSKIYY